MKKYSIGFLLLFSLVSSYSQDVVNYQKMIDSLILKDSHIELIEAVSAHKRIVDLQFYETLYDNYKFFTNRDKRLHILKTIIGINWYQFRERSQSNQARSLYRNGLLSLIRECENDLEELKIIRVYPAYHSEIYNYLKSAIINAGGVWERGEIPVYQSRIPVRGSLIPESDGVTSTSFSDITGDPKLGPGTKVFFLNSSKKEADDLFTKRELEILICSASRMSIQEIAEQQGISKNTVERHRKNMIAKVGVTNMTGVIRISQILNLV